MMMSVLWEVKKHCIKIASRLSRMGLLNKRVGTENRARAGVGSASSARFAVWTASKNRISNGHRALCFRERVPQRQTPDRERPQVNEGKSGRVKNPAKLQISGTKLIPGCQVLYVSRLYRLRPNYITYIICRKFISEIIITRDINYILVDEGCFVIG